MLGIIPGKALHRRRFPEGLNIQRPEMTVARKQKKEPEVAMTFGSFE